MLASWRFIGFMEGFRFRGIVEQDGISCGRSSRNQGLCHHTTCFVYWTRIYSEHLVLFFICFFNPTDLLCCYSGKAQKSAERSKAGARAGEREEMRSSGMSEVTMQIDPETNANIILTTQTCTTCWTVKHSDNNWGILDGNMNIECVEKKKIMWIVQSIFSSLCQRNQLLFCVVFKKYKHTNLLAALGDVGNLMQNEKRTGEKQGKHRE